MMWTFYIVLALLLLLVWALLSRVIIALDTSIPAISITWGQLAVVARYNDSVVLQVSLFFFTKRIALNRIPWKRSNRKKPVKRRRRKRGLRKQLAFTMVILRSWRLEEWKLVLDTNDAAVNGMLYPLQLLPLCRGHLFINFIGENFLRLQLSARPATILLRLLRVRIFHH